MKRTLVIIAALGLTASPPVLAQHTPTEYPSADVTFIDTEGTEVGRASLVQSAAGVQISGDVSGLSPGQHGFHIHETGVCDPEGGFESAGGHFNPTDMGHGLDDADGPHAGDMPNQTTEDNNILRFDLVNDRVSLIEGNADYLLDEDGSAIVVHANQDDQTTDPSGNSGPRVACGVITAVGT